MPPAPEPDFACNRCLWRVHNRHDGRSFSAVSLRVKDIRWDVPPVAFLGGVFAVDDIFIAEICARLTLVAGHAEPRGLAITMVRPTLRLNCGRAPVSHLQHGSCTCVRIQRFKELLGNLRLRIVPARAQKVLARLFCRVSAVVEGVSVQLACHTQAASNGTSAQVLALTVDSHAHAWG
jgi:hypothetical protein